MQRYSKAGALLCLVWFSNSLGLTCSGGLCLASGGERPNFVVLFADDLGYADLGCFGGSQMSTPNLDRLAEGGMRLTSFYVAQAVCSASRSSLLTGCLNVRISIHGALGPGSRICLNPAETTLAEMLKARGYATAVFGKWHLGDRGAGLPAEHGFDNYQGLPYSNDMWPHHPSMSRFPALPLLRNRMVLNAHVTGEDQCYLTRWATEQAVEFIKRHQRQPFLLYVPYSMPHVPLYASPEFQGSTGQGLYADVVAEIDWSVGQIVSAINQIGAGDNTLVLFTSDNGPWLSYGSHAGSAAPLREGKGTAWEGGVRVPTVASWPGRIPSGAVCDEVAGTIDILPTLAELSGAELPRLPIDGRSIWPLLAGTPGAASPHKAWYYYWDRELQAVRSGRWKLHFPHSYRTLKSPPPEAGMPGQYAQKKCGLELYDLWQDISESRNLADSHPDVVTRLQGLADPMRQELGDSLMGIAGTGVRHAGVVE
ncbi:MAG: sulfatase [Pirellulaceae bacterium]|nr:sulfatase [Pirellulaceae bacterium]